MTCGCEAPKTWEYMTYSAETLAIFVAKADHFGEDGWELVQFADSHGHTVGVFKRPVKHVHEQE